MSLIERAVDRMKTEPARKPAARDSVVSNAAGTTALQPVQQPGAAIHDEHLAAKIRTVEEAMFPDPISVLDPGTHGGPTSVQAHVNLANLRIGGYITPDNDRSTIAEEFRNIKRPILNNAFGATAGRHGNLIMVTSALPNEGKTFTAINIAISVAMERDHRVLLIDGDVRKPSAMQTLGVDTDRGLLEAIQDSPENLGKYLLRTDVPKLSVLPAGRAQPLATELLSSDACARLLTEIAERYSDRLIIVDSPPLLLTTEAKALASHMGQVILVVRANSTPREAIVDATHMVADCPLVSLVLNRQPEVKAGTFSTYYGYGYGYGDSTRIAE